MSILVRAVPQKRVLWHDYVAMLFCLAPHIILTCPICLIQFKDLVRRKNPPPKAVVMSVGLCRILEGWQSQRVDTAN